MEDLNKEINEVKQKYKNFLEDLPLSKQWSIGAIHRANSGFYFLKRCLECIHKGGTDPARSRSIYILLSYNCELLLTAYLLALLNDECPQKTASELKELLKGKNNHDLYELSEKIGKKNLRELGIKDVKLETKKDLKRYTITLMSDEKIVAEDLVTVRYDFEFDKLRDTNIDESDEMNRGIDKLIEMTKTVMKMLPEYTQGQ